MLEKHAEVTIDLKSSTLYECIDCGDFVKESEYDKSLGLCKNCKQKEQENGSRTSS